MRKVPREILIGIFVLLSSLVLLLAANPQTRLLFPATQTKVYAQIIPLDPLEGTEAAKIGADSQQTESCFAYYDYGKVAVNLTTEQSTYSPGEKAKIHGTLVNNNTFPLMDVILYAHIMRVNNNNKSFINNGHYLIDRLTLVEGLNFLPGETKWVEAQIPILPTYPNGDYQLSYFVFSKEGFHYAGRPFVEGDAAGYSSFKVEGRGGAEAYMFFDVDSLKVGGLAKNIRGLIEEFPQRPIPISVGLIDNLGNTKNLSAKISFYKFEDTFERYKVLKRVVNLNEAELETVFFPPGPGAYVFLAEIEEPVRTAFKYRFAVEGARSQQLRMNDLGVSDFPAKKDSRAWVCFHSPTNNNSPLTKVVLSVLDKDKEVVERKEVTREFSPQVMAISLPLVNLKTVDDFWVRAEFSVVDNPQLVQTAEKHFSCQVFGQSQTDFKVSYDGAGKKLNITGLGVCPAVAGGGGGYIESVRVKDDQGQIVKENYNISAKEGLDLSDLSAGSYLAEVESGGQAKRIKLAVAAEKFKKPSKRGGVILGMAIILGILGFGGFWLRKYLIAKKDE